MTNEQRAELAYRALLVFMQGAGMEEDVPTGITDLLANLMHLCGEYGDDFEDLLDTATQHYEHEVAYPEEAS